MKSNLSGRKVFLDILSINFYLMKSNKFASFFLRFSGFTSYFGREFCDIEKKLSKGLLLSLNTLQFIE